MRYIILICQKKKKMKCNDSYEDFPHVTKVLKKKIEKKYN